MTRKPSVNRRLTPDEIRTCHEMVAAGASRAQMAERIGLPTWVLDVRRADDLSGLPNRRGRGGGKYIRGHVDDPREIERRRDEVRSRWDPQEREFRAGRGLLPENYKPKGIGRGWAAAPVRGVISSQQMRAANDPRYW